MSNKNTEVSKIDPIEQYYRDVDARKREAEEKLKLARENGATPKEIAKLEERALWAGYTGD